MLFIAMHTNEKYLDDTENILRKDGINNILTQILHWNGDVVVFEWKKFFQCKISLPQYLSRKGVG